MESHLNDDQIDELLRPAWGGEIGSTAERAGQEDVRAHLRTCQSCQSKVRVQEKVMERLTLLKVNTPMQSGRRCPPESVWIEIAAGTGTPDSQSYLSHAIECDYCGPLLEHAAADFADALTPQEASQIAALTSSTSAWQKQLAARLSDIAAVRTTKPLRRRFWSSWFMDLNSLARFGFATLFLGLIVGGVGLTVHLKKLKTPDRLIEGAYAEKRTIELRIEGAPYVPLRQERGGDAGQLRMERPALLKAEAEISERLKADPDNVGWLQARGRASLLEQNPQAAIDSLEEAKRLANEDDSVSIDLASAYILRGEAAGEAEDFGRAIELLKVVLVSHPHNEVAQFNYAIALEKQLLKRDAIEEWEQFLIDHPMSPWAQEASGRLATLRQQTLLRKQRSERPLMTPEQVSVAASRRPQADEIDARIEEYQDVAVQEWLPQFSRAAPSHIKEALSCLAALLNERHHDRWLLEILSAMRGSAQVRKAVQLMSESERLVRSSDDDRALQAATQASSLFEKAGVSAGMARAKFATIFIYQLRHENLECAEAARALSTIAQRRRYEWIRIQSEIEAGICVSLDGTEGLDLLQDAQHFSQEYGYRILEMRAVNALSGQFWARGDLHKAWAEDAIGLREYWAGDAESLRGYNLLANLDDIVEEQKQWYLAAAILNESIPMIAQNPEHAMRAFEQARLGDVLLRIGDVDGAEESFRETQRLFQSVPLGTRRKALSAEAEIGLANAQIERGNFQAAVSRLEALRSIITKVHEDDLRLSYFQASGIAWMRLGSPIPAEENLHAALQLAEKGLLLVKNENERLQWSRRNEPVYKAMVALKLRTDSLQALGYWEWYKGASLRGRRPADQDAAPTLQHLASNLRFSPSPLGGDAAFVSYALLPGGLSVWVWDRSGIRQRWISVSQPALNSLILKYVEHCSNPNYPMESVRIEGADLYRIIILPIEPWIASSHRLIFEPDGDLSLLPLEALVDSHGDYLSDRFAISISPGLEFLADSRSWNGVSRQSAALIVGNPAVSGWSALPDAEQEARVVAGFFSHPHLLLNTSVSDTELARGIPGVDVFHFSGHSYADVQSAGLVVGNSGLFGARNLREPFQRRTQLVVLSACASVRGTTGFFNDEDSLVERLAEAGVPEIVASRWMVDSSSTAALMQEFYSRLLQGQTVADSLRGAGQSLRASARFAHPFYWAGFGAFGRG